MRLITRSDFDGLACAVLLKEAGIVDSYTFVHPKDVRDGRVPVTANDVLANIPYVPGCGMWFDHHSSELERIRLSRKFNYEGRSELAPSCARVIYDYFGGAAVFSAFDENGMMAAVDKCDSANFSAEDIERPDGWVLLSFIMDPRTGLGRFNDYRISNYRLMEDLIHYCRSCRVEEILANPDVRQRINRYFQQEEAYTAMLQDNTEVDGNVLIINLLDVYPMPAGNRFKEYVLFPDSETAMRIIWGCHKQNVVITCGHSVLNRSPQCKDIGALMASYGGGGHRTVGACQVAESEWQQVKDQLVAVLKTT